MKLLFDNHIWKIFHCVKVHPICNVLTATVLSWNELHIILIVNEYDIDVLGHLSQSITLSRPKCGHLWYVLLCILDLARRARNTGWCTRFAGDLRISLPTPDLTRGSIAVVKRPWSVRHDVFEPASSALGTWAAFHCWWVAFWPLPTW